MTVETGNNISDLNQDNPVLEDPAGEGAEHLRLIKRVLKTTFANINAPVTLTDEQLNALAADVFATLSALTLQDGSLLVGSGGDIEELAKGAAGRVLTAAASGLEWSEVTAETDLGTANRTGDSIDITSSTGDNVTLDGATDSAAGLLIATDKQKLETISDDVEANPPTASEVEARAGTSTALRSWSPALIEDAIDALGGDDNPATASASEAQEGTETNLRSWSPSLISEAISALGGGGGGGTVHPAATAKEVAIGTETALRSFSPARVVQAVEDHSEGLRVDAPDGVGLNRIAGAVVAENGFYYLTGSTGDVNPTDGQLNFFNLDTNTGEQVGNADNYGIPTAWIHGSAFFDGILYAVDNTAHQVVTINLETGVATPVGEPNALLPQVGGMAFSPDGICYGVARVTSDSPVPGANRFFTINVTTNQFTPLGNAGSGGDFVGLAIDSNYNAFVAISLGLIPINLTGDRLGNTIPFTSTFTSNRAGGIGFDSNNILYGTFNHGNADAIHIVNTTTGALTRVGTASVPNGRSLAFDKTDEAYNFTVEQVRNTVVGAPATNTEAEAGTEEALRSWSPNLIRLAILALGGMTDEEQEQLAEALAKSRTNEHKLSAVTIDHIAATDWGAIQPTDDIRIGLDTTTGGIPDIAYSAMGAVIPTLQGVSGYLIAAWNPATINTPLIRIGIPVTNGTWEYLTEFASDADVSGLPNGWVAKALSQYGYNHVPFPVITSYPSGTILLIQKRGAVDTPVWGGRIGSNIIATENIQDDAVTEAKIADAFVQKLTTLQGLVNGHTTDIATQNQTVLSILTLSRFKGAWVSTGTYVANDEVSHNGSYWYVSNASGSGAVPTSSSNRWTQATGNRERIIELHELASWIPPDPNDNQDNIWSGGGWLHNDGPAALHLAEQNKVVIDEVTTTSHTYAAYADISDDDIHDGWAIAASPAGVVPNADAFSGGEYQGENVASNLFIAVPRHGDSNRIRIRVIQAGIADSFHPAGGEQWTPATTIQGAKNSLDYYRLSTSGGQPRAVTPPTTTTYRLQIRPIASTGAEIPLAKLSQDGATAGQVIGWNDSTSRYEPTDQSGGGASLTQETVYPVVKTIFGGSGNIEAVDADQELNVLDFNIADLGTQTVANNSQVAIIDTDDDMGRATVADLLALGGGGSEPPSDAPSNAELSKFAGTGFTRASGFYFLQSGNNGETYWLSFYDIETDTASRIGNSNHFGLDDRERVNVLAWYDGVLYGYNNSTNSQERHLLSIDIETGVGTQIGPHATSPFDNGIVDMSFNSEGVLYALNSSEGLVTINTTTGAQARVDGSSIISSLQNDKVGFAIDSTNTAYRATHSRQHPTIDNFWLPPQLIFYSLPAGQLLQGRGLDLTGFPMPNVNADSNRPIDLAFTGDGILYGIFAYGGSVTSPHLLARIDTDTGVVTPITTTTIARSWAMVFNRDFRAESTYSLSPTQAKKALDVENALVAVTSLPDLESTTPVVNNSLILLQQDSQSIYQYVSVGSDHLPYHNENVSLLGEIKTRYKPGFYQVKDYVHQHQSAFIGGVMHSSLFETGVYWMDTTWNNPNSLCLFMRFRQVGSGGRLQVALRTDVLATYKQQVNGDGALAPNLTGDTNDLNSHTISMFCYQAHTFNATERVHVENLIASDRGLHDQNSAVLGLVPTTTRVWNDGIQYTIFHVLPESSSVIQVVPGLSLSSDNFQNQADLATGFTIRDMINYARGATNVEAGEIDFVQDNDPNRPAKDTGGGSFPVLEDGTNSTARYPESFRPEPNSTGGFYFDFVYNLASPLSGQVPRTAVFANVSKSITPVDMTSPAVYFKPVQDQLGNL